MEFTTKQKIIIISIIIVLIIVGIYVYNIRFSEDINENTNENQLNTSFVENILEKDDKNKEIIVHITGAVKKNGIVKLKDGARIYDAIEMAGGSTDDADLSKINLAYVLEDGQKVYIPKIGEINQENAEEEYITFEYGNNKNIIQDYNKGGNEKVNINTANQTELETLPGIGTATAEKIIDYRNKNGKFSSIEDIQNVKGIGNAKYENIKESICVK
ncbi:MAG: helix-hairpin-helix domain-containing protein [Clostridia bacterium]|nr:competence protein ComEA helix-hairpin-helix repeat protein [Clostridium sp. CAG:571]HJJ06644.1 helix-hairpin-helix domain-containing protein [Clostridiaceae bacterium]HJJ13857.1 helix-hairpin-helix domain-containing protein [Clostridiaceae bacterium]